MSVTHLEGVHPGIWTDFVGEMLRVRRIVRQRIGQTIAMAACAGALAGALLMSSEPAEMALRGSLATHAYADEPIWIDIPKPFQLFAVTAPGFERLPQTYEARRHRVGGGREDILTFGRFEGPGAYARLVMHRLGTEPAAPASFFLDIARRGAEAGLSVTRAGATRIVQTRFGAVETAEVALASSQDQNAACAAFRFRLGEGVLQATGFACGGEQAMDATSFSCLLERIDLVAAGDDAELRAAFGPSELRRDLSCGPKGLAARARSAALDQPSPPPVKSVGLRR